MWHFYGDTEGVSSRNQSCCNIGVTWRKVVVMNPKAETVARSELRYQFDAEVGERVTTLRKRVGLTQKALAGALGVNEGTMSEKITAGPWYAWEIAVIATKVNSTIDVLYGTAEMPPATVSSIVGRRRTRSVGRTGLEPVTDGL